jgi:hypothetical protein
MVYSAASTGEYALGPLCRLWLDKIEKARQHKKEHFTRTADECFDAYIPETGNFNHWYQGDLQSSRGVSIDVQAPQFRMTICKMFEIVSIFGPLLYAQNPIRQVNPKLPVDIPPTAIPDPMLFMVIQQQEQNRTNLDALKSLLMATYLNWTPNELGLKEDSDLAIKEAIIKGRGVMWTSTITPPGSKTKMVGSFYDSVDFLFIDPDAEEFNKAWWICRQICQPIWEVERRFGLRAGSLKGSYESANMQTEVESHKKYLDRQRGRTNDLMVYYEIYSRMGCGGRLSGSGVSRGESDLLPGDLNDYTELLDPLVGDFVYMVVAKGVNYPLNLPPEIQDLPMTGDGSPTDGIKHIKDRLAWPVTYWADPQKGAGVMWPCSVLDFHTVPRSPWPMSILKPALAELRFLCWAYSFVCSKIKNTLRDVVAILKEMADNFKMTVLEGADLSALELDTQNRDIRECVQILQFPQMNADIWRIIEAVERNFDKRVGLNEIFYGTSQMKQDRSATESDIKSQNQNIRPDDMARKVEAWMTEIARKEGLAARMLLEPNDILPVLGVAATALWTLYVKSNDLSVFHELEYRIEAGSTRKPNRDRDQANADSAMQILLPVFNAFAQGTGKLGPINALLAYWCKTRDIAPGPFQLPLPPPPPVAPGGPPPPGAHPPGRNGAAPPPQHAGASTSQGGPPGAPKGTR